MLTLLFYAVFIGIVIPVVLLIIILGATAYNSKDNTIWRILFLITMKINLEETSGLCRAFKVTYQFFYNEISYCGLVNHFPYLKELLKKQGFPNSRLDRFWFSIDEYGYRERQKLLNQLIKHELKIK